LLRIGVRAADHHVKTGEGSLRVGNETATVRAGDAIPLRINEVHALRNTGSQPIEIIIIGIAEDMTKNVETVAE
jgi:mannose-6-phosphate isomerase-like protein (cupin superfamily)